MPRITTTVAQEVIEDILSYDHHIASKTFHIVVGTMMESTYTNPVTEVVTDLIILDESIPLQQTRLNENNYEALLSPNPSWSPDKAAGVFSEDDLWLCVIAQRNNSDLEIGSV